MVYFNLYITIAFFGLFFSFLLFLVSFHETDIRAAKRLAAGSLFWPITLIVLFSFLLYKAALTFKGWVIDLWKKKG